MTAILLDGRKAANELLSSLKSRIALLNPRLVIVQVGDDPGSESYIRQKIKSCESVGLRSSHIHLSQDTTLDELLQTIDELNHDSDVSGFIVQVPLPGHLQKDLPIIIRAIDPKKDVDGFGAYNMGKTMLSKEFEHLPPATPAGIITLLEYYDIDIAWKHAVIVGRSNIVGKPLACMLLNRDATVTICHSKTRNLSAMTIQADILIVAIGKPKCITADMVKDGAVVIDVGVNRVLDHAMNHEDVQKQKLVGDTDFDAISLKASAITPVPGGVGPMTVASLIRNCVSAAERHIENK